MNHRGRLLLLSLFLLSAATAEDNPSQYRTVPCPPDAVAERITCGELTVPENRLTGDGQVRISVIRLSPPAPVIPPTAVLGGGGPGGELGLDGLGITFWENYRQEILGDKGELILIDQRGAGSSTPLLNCPRLNEKIIEWLPQFLPAKDFPQVIIPALRHCLRQLRQAGIEVTAYTTDSSARDMNDLRRLLGLTEWNIIGYSYGSRLALELLRQWPQSVRAAVLESPLPADFFRLPPAYPVNSALKKVSAACARLEACAVHGDLRKNVMRLIRQLRERPQRLTVRHEGKPRPMALTADDVLAVLIFGTYRSDLLSILPTTVQQWSSLEIPTHSPAVRIYLQNYLDFVLDERYASLLNWSINCHETQLNPPPPASPLERIEWEASEQLTKMCGDLFPNLRAQLAAPVKSRRPVLIIGGTFDPATPVEWARTLQNRLADSRLLTVPGGHTPSLTFSCLRQAMRDFLVRPDGKKFDHCGIMKPLFY